jgi:DNA-binding FadR family transcriptional regulator
MRSNLLSKIEQRRLPQEVTQQILMRIARGDYAQGDSLPNEHEMAAQFGVSRIVIREATRLLSSKRVIDVQQGRGTFVTDQQTWNHMDPQILEALLKAGRLGELAQEIVEMRTLLEVEAAGLAAQRAQPADIETLRDLLTAMSAVADTDTDAYIQLEHAFHIQIWQTAHNRLLLQTLESLSGVFRLVKELVYKHNWQDVDRDHRLVVAAIEKNDPKAARAAALQDILRFEDEILQALMNGLDL